jgi:hypothetical protein
MKAVLMSIQPKWCELIASRKKTVEVRKTKPKLDVPFYVADYLLAKDGTEHANYDRGWDKRPTDPGAKKVYNELLKRYN